MAAFITGIFSSVVFLMGGASASTGRNPHKWRDTGRCPLVRAYGKRDLAGYYV